MGLGSLRMLMGRAADVHDPDVLRGLEGQAAAVYFSHFGKLIRTGEFRFERRTRRPPRDPINAMLSFGYAVLGSLAETEVLRCGLDPMLGFFHQPAYGRPSLMLDVLEEFRPLIDGLVLRVVNRRQVGAGDFVRRGGRELAELLAEDGDVRPPAAAGQTAWEPGAAADRISADAGVTADTTQDGPETAEPSDAEPPWDESPTPAEPARPANGVVGVYLGDVGRKVFLNELFRRLRERLRYPPRDASLELRDILRQQIYQMARVIERKQDEYEPFMPG